MDTITEGDTPASSLRSELRLTSSSSDSSVGPVLPRRNEETEVKKVYVTGASPVLEQVPEENSSSNDYEEDVKNKSVESY